MRIVRLTAENVKKIKVVDISPPSGLVQVTGKNGSGKTSVLDSIWWALAGAAAIQSVPIRTGSEEARIRLDLGDIIVTRKFTAAGTSVVVLNSAGAEPGTPDKKLPKWGSPQDVLDALLAKLSFDPLAFSRMSPKAQLDELRRVSKLDANVDILDAQNKADAARRTEVNRQAKTKRAQADGILVAKNLPDQPVDESALLNDLEAAGQHNASIETTRAQRERRQRDAADKRAASALALQQAEDIRGQARERIAELKKQIEDVERSYTARAENLEAQAIESTAAAAKIEEELAGNEPLPEPIRLSDLRAKLDDAKTVNAALAVRERRRQINTEADVLESQAKEITHRIAGREEARAAAIRAAKMPVEGLGFGEGGVVYNGLPLEQASDAEQLRVSCSIAMAANAKLRVIRIKDGSLLDDDGLKLIGELAAENDYQVWLERVDGSGKIGIVMEDGEVAATNQEAE